MTDFGGSIKKSQDYQFAVIGAPYDEKSCYLKGTAEGPRAIREASTSAAINACTELGADLEEDTVVVDAGDVDVSCGFPEAFNRIQEKVKTVLDAGAVPVLMGGDHSVTYPSVKAVAAVHKKLDILHFDAHPDLYEDLYGDRYSHACPFARIMEEGLAENLVQVGIRAATPSQRKNALRYGVRMFEMKNIEQVPSLAFSNPLYISVDMDALDPAFAPGVSHHEPGGLSTREMLRIIHNIEAEIIGMDLVELNPSRDISGITADAAVKIIMEIMGKIVAMKKMRGV